MFNPGDAYYVGEAMPCGGVFAIGVLATLLVGWLLRKRKK